MSQKNYFLGTQKRKAGISLGLSLRYPKLLLHQILSKTHQHRGCLGTGCAGAGPQSIVLEAVDKSQASGPAHCSLCPILDLAAIGILGQISQGGQGNALVLGIGSNQVGDLSAGDGLILAEGGAFKQAHGSGPVDAVGVTFFCTRAG